MRIVVNTISDPVYPFTPFLAGWVDEWKKCNPEHEIIVLTREDERLSPVTDIDIVSVKAPSSFLSASFKQRIKKELKRLQPDRFFSVMPLSGMEGYIWIASPLELMMKEAAHAHNQAEYVSKLQKEVTSAGSIVLFTIAETMWLIDKLKIQEEKIKLVYKSPATLLSPAGWEERESVKEQYADGNEYFLCHPTKSVEVLTWVLKAFSGFKKWQRSNMKLLVSAETELHEAVKNLLEHYRFHDDVVVTEAENDIYYKLLRSAYAVLLPERFFPATDLMYAAFSCEVPVLTAGASACADVSEGASLNFVYENKEDLTRVMLEIFRDEQLRGQLVSKGKQILAVQLELPATHPFQRLISNS